MRGTTIPTPHQVFNSYKYNMRGKSVNIDLKHLEVIVGSYLCVAGAVLGMVKRGRISLIGLSMIIWGVTREIITGSKNATQAKCIYPEMIFTLIAAFFSVTKDVRRLIGCCMPNCYSKPRFD
ncbi:hypothetical protein CASFOL_024797 [Castilleja foliolosa]|uniref:Uncharacterized protein n=1 Tax=Castilleja foliolosa TaxID=1961234 RepID=A0ABD3CPD7_9LAMI